MAIIKSVMKTDVKVCAPGTSVAEVAVQMRDLKVGAVLVVENDALKGVFTERDLLNRVVAEGKDPRDTQVIDVATTNPVTVKSNAHIRDCAVILNERGFRHLPVVGDDGKPIGIVSSRDFFRFITEQLETVIDKVRLSEAKIEEDLDLYELVGGGGYGIPRAN